MNKQQRGTTVDERTDIRDAIAEEYEASAEIIGDALEWFANLDDPQDHYPALMAGMVHRYVQTPEFESVVDATEEVGMPTWKSNVTPISAARKSVVLDEDRTEFIVALLNTPTVRAEEGDDRIDRAISWLTGISVEQLGSYRRHPSHGGAA